MQQLARKIASIDFDTDRRDILSAKLSDEQKEGDSEKLPHRCRPKGVKISEYREAV
jgi:hypothetical protein